MSTTDLTEETKSSIVEEPLKVIEPVQVIDPFAENVKLEAEFAELLRLNTELSTEYSRLEA
jgi:hypothetical protein